MLLPNEMLTGLYRLQSQCKPALLWKSAKGQRGLSRWAQKHAPFWIPAIIVLVILFALPKASCLDDDLYTIQIDLPAKTIRDVIIKETIPRGVVYSAGSLKVTGASTNPLETVSDPNDGSQPVNITWSFGDIDNSINEDLLVRFLALVADTNQNRDGVILPPSVAFLEWKDQAGVVHSSSAKSTPIKIIEPSLQIEQLFKPSAAWSGDNVTCTISLYNTLSGHADAFDTEVIESLPQGLIYSRGSMKIVAGPKGTIDESNSQKLRWHFDKIDRSWSEAKAIQLSFNATIDRGAKQGQLISTASLVWASSAGDYPQKRIYSESAEGSINVISRPPSFVISVADYPNPARPGEELTYAISYKNNGGNALRTIIRASYDASNISFISANPAPDPGTENRWTLGELIGGGSGTIGVKVRVNPSVADGVLLSSLVKISSEDGASAQDTAITKVLNKTPALVIEKTSSDKFIRPGDLLDYTITYQNSGNDNATNVTIIDIVDKNLDFVLADSNPRPSEIWIDQDGTHLWWNASILKTEVFEPGGSGEIQFKASLPLVPEHPEFDWVYNNYRIDSDQNGGKLKTLETPVIHSLFVRKKAEKVAYSEGEIVNYTIIYGNDLAVDADNAVITDALPNIEYIGSKPQPTFIRGNILVWNIGKIPPKMGGRIQLYARIRENYSELSYKMAGFVSGEGFVNIRQNLNTVQNPDRLINMVNITGFYMGIPDSDSSSATIFLADARGTALNIRGYGSGSYQREDESRMLEKNKSIEVKTSLEESYYPTNFHFPNNRSINFSSKWSEAKKSKNSITGATLSEVYMYANQIKHDSSLELDKNGSTLSTETYFHGAGHIGALKKQSPDASPKVALAYESQENYLGSFKVISKVDEYGQNVAVDRSVSGTGMAASDRRVGQSQRSYESGTGTYQSEERIQTVTNYMSKAINGSHSPMNYTYAPDFKVNISNKWKEGMWSKSWSYSSSPKGSHGFSPATFIGEEYSNINYLKKSTEAKGLNQMDTEAEFSGKAAYTTVKSPDANGTKNEVTMYEEYIGRYKVSHRTSLEGVAKYDRPHLNVSKVGTVDLVGRDLINYSITVVNDGNKALGPVYVLDQFPPGTQYVYSSLRPTEQGSNYCQWTLTSLGIGDRTQLWLNLNISGNVDHLINRIEAKGGYNGTWIRAENFSALGSGWLSCCSPQLSALKEGYVDPKDPMLVHYRILLKNRMQSIMVANVTDQLPSGMTFVNSSISPSNQKSNQVSWNFIDIGLGEVKAIDYQTRAMHSGMFVNQAHIEAYYLNGTDSSSGDVESSVNIGGVSSSSSGFGWQPPSCFGINCTTQSYGSDWMACPACGGAEAQPLSSSTCSPCISSAGNGEGYDIP
jgi:uncharacterized repeat protein (TIGR01451 family)